MQAANPCQQGDGVLCLSIQAKAAQAQRGATGEGQHTVVQTQSIAGACIVQRQRAATQSQGAAQRSACLACLQSAARSNLQRITHIQRASGNLNGTGKGCIYSRKRCAARAFL